MALLRLLVRDRARRACRGGHRMPGWITFDRSLEIWTDPSKSMMEQGYRICATYGRCV
jgi:hypothetical protein